MRNRTLRSITLASLVVALGAHAAGCAPKGQQNAVKTPTHPAQATTTTPPPPGHEEPIDPAMAAKVDEIVGKNIAARGGLEKLRAIQSLRCTGKLRIARDGFSIETAYAEEVKRPGSVRIERSYQGFTGVNAYDGTEAWATQPFQGRRDPFRESADDAKQLAESADIDGPLVDWREKGHRVDYLGTEEIDGTPALKLRVRLKDGNIEYHYLDPDAFLTIRIVSETRHHGVESVSETDFGDYEQVAGVWMPLSAETGPKGERRFVKLQIETAEANVALDDAAFHFPAAGTKVARTIFAAKDAPPPQAPAAAAAPEGAPVFDSGVVSGLGARNIGSATMSGRVAALAAYVEGGKTTVFVGAASGGVWKSIDGGTTFKPIFDKEPVQSIGAIAIDPMKPSTVWVGTGESWTRNSTSIGDGIYKSTDGGATWKNMGLPESERITKILVDPRSGDTVYACVPGKLWSDSNDRGLYKTTDGGKTWSLVLKGPNASTGCSGISIDPKNPDVLFAGMWDFRRKGWTFRSGGDGPDAPSGSGMFRSADGGKTWTPLTSASSHGLPNGPWGRVEVAVAPSDGRVVYALIESTDSALYRSADGGATWERRDNSQQVVWRPFYFARLIVDPVNPDRIFKPDLFLVESEDGGRSFTDVHGGTHADTHDVWIDPTNTKHVIAGDDGGLWTSFDGGVRWWKSNNLPISQFYHVAVDNRDPYQVYGGLQDNSSWVGDSAYPGGITNERWENLYGGDGFWAVPDPTDPDAVYVESQGGEIGRINRKTLAVRRIQPTAGYHEKLRFNWNTPIATSPTQPGVVYIGAQFLFRSKDRGDTWERISPDLSTNDPEKQKQEQSGGVTVDNSSAEMHTTIYSISESPKDARTIWVGTDDGNLQLTRDGGKSWTNVAPNVAGLPPASWVSWVEASRFDAGTAYAAFDRHTFGDMTPWVFKTTDYGKTWTRIVAPASGVRGYAHVIKEDAVKPQLLYLGTEFGLWMSIDGGASWAQFKGGGFPDVAVRDLQVQTREDDLVIGTHGRGIWIIDDLLPLRSLTTGVLGQAAEFLPSHAAQQRMVADGGWADGDATFVGQNPAGGAVITYYQRARHLFGRLKLEVLDPSGKVIDTVHASTRRGINRVVWTMKLPAPRVPKAATVAFNATQGPRVLPGTYTLRLTKAGQTLETKLDVTLDRRAPYTIADRKAQFDAAMRAYSLFGDMSALADRIDAARAAIDARTKALGQNDPLLPKLAAVATKLDDTKKLIVATKEGGAITGEERIREHLDQLYGVLTDWEGRPAQYQIERIDVLHRELGDVATQLDAIVKNDIAPLDEELKQKKLDPIPTTARASDGEGDQEVRAAMECAESLGNACEETEVRAVQEKE